MVFDGFKKFFNRIGGVTVDSSRKVGEGVSAPVDRLNSRRSERRISSDESSSERSSEAESSKKLSLKTSSITEGLRRSSKPRRSQRTIERRRMDKDEIEIFKELVDKKYQRGTKEKEVQEDQAKKAAYTKASLEELLKDEEKEGVDPKLIMIMGGVSFALVVVIMVVLGFGIEIGLVFGLAIFMMSVVIIFLPNLQKGKRSNEASRELPYALRQMATELKAGLGLHDSMRSVAMSGYGALSEEFARTLEEIKYGETTEKALVDLSERIQSEGLSRAVHQITRTLSSGGDLSKTLNVIAEDTSYEMRMKLKDYAQKLNSFTMIYMFIAILAPVVCLIMIIAASTVMGPFIPPILLLIMYLFMFPMVVAFMAFMIKRLEPQI